MFTQNGIRLQIALTFFNANHQVLHRSIFRMENIIERFFVFKGYKSVSKWVNGGCNLSEDKLEDFCKFVKDKRNKRKSSSLSFEVGSLKINFSETFFR